MNLRRNSTRAALVLAVMSVGETTPYKPMVIERKSAVGWNKGTKVILLDDAGGKPGS